MERSASSRGHDCPSAQPDMAGARPFGLVSGSVEEVRIAFFKKDALAHFDWRERFGSPEATQLFRFAAQCERSGCGHYDAADDQCSLGRRVATGLAPVTEALPPCLIRPSCRWHAEQGPAVCLRCPQVTTMIPPGDGPMQTIAAPPTRTSLPGGPPSTG